ncbi:MAG: hypothetical protein VW519_09060 [Luminiphilus sp.]
MFRFAQCRKDRYHMLSRWGQQVRILGRGSDQALRHDAFVLGKVEVGIDQAVEQCGVAFFVFCAGVFDESGAILQ